MKRLGWVVLLAAVGCVRSVADVPTDEGGFITGTVVARDRASGLFQPVVGARIELVGASVGRTSSAEGAFELRRLPLGAHTLDLEVRAAGATAKLARRLGGLRLEADGQSLDLGDVRLGGLSDVEGRVTLEGIAADGAAEGTTVVLVASPFQTIVGRDGRYRFADIPPGPYEVAAYRAGYLPARIDGVDIGAGLTATLKSIALQPADPGAQFEVAGFVEVVDGDPEGVRVTFIEETTTASQASFGPSMTDATGAYDITLPAGVYRGRYEKAGYRPAERRNLVVTPSGVLGLDRVILGLGPDGDADGDGTPNAEDPDDDDDGCFDAMDAFPLDPLRCFDDDGDGLADSEDPDNDNDTLLDVEEVSEGRDGWITNPFDPDTDDDGLGDASDGCPLLPSPSVGVPHEDLDGDGVGDACQASMGGGGTTTATVTGFAPSTQGIGLPLTVMGDGLASAIGVEFEGGAFARAYAVTPAAFTVDVPRLALDGPLRVFFPGGLTLTTTNFTVRPGPVVTDYTPRRTSYGATVTLVGEQLDRITQVWVGGQAAPLMSGTPTSRTFTIPNTVGAGTVAVEYDTPARVAAPGALQILEDPFIQQVAPNPVPAGTAVTIYGMGFLGDSFSDPVTVTIGGVDVVATNPSERVISVPVPAGATTGDVTVSRSGRTSLPFPIVIDDGSVALSFVDPPILFEGETLSLIGANLHDPANGYQLQAVRIGTVPVTVTQQAPSIVEVTVPTGAQSSLVEVDVLRGGNVETATLESGPVILREAAVGPNAVPCGVTDSNQLIAFFNSGTAYRLLDYGFVNEAAVSGVPSGFGCAEFSVSPNRQRGIAVLQGDRIKVVDIRTLNSPIPPCDPRATRPGLNVYFARNGNVAYDSLGTTAYLPWNDSSETGLLRVDLNTGACDEIGVLQAAVIAGVTMVPASNDQELAIYATGAAGILDLSQAPPAYSVPAPRNGQSFGATVHVDPDLAHLWIQDATKQVLPGSTRVDFTMTSGGASFGLQSPDLRFIFGSGRIADLRTRRSAPYRGGSTSQYFLVSPTTQRPTVYTTNSSNQLTLIEVVQAPPF